MTPPPLSTTPEAPPEAPQESTKQEALASESAAPVKESSPSGIHPEFRDFLATPPPLPLKAKSDELFRPEPPTSSRPSAQWMPQRPFPPALPKQVTEVPVSPPSSTAEAAAIPPAASPSTNRFESLDGPLLWASEEKIGPAGSPKLAASDTLPDAITTAASNLATIHDVAKAPSSKPSVAPASAPLESTTFPGSMNTGVPNLPQIDQSKVDRSLQTTVDRYTLATESWPVELRSAIVALQKVLPQGVQAGVWLGADDPTGQGLPFYPADAAADRKPLSEAELYALFDADPQKTEIHTRYKLLRDQIGAVIRNVDAIKKEPLPTAATPGVRFEAKKVQPPAPTAPNPAQTVPEALVVQSEHREVKFDQIDQSPASSTSTGPEVPVAPITGTEPQTPSVPETALVSAARQQLDNDIKELQALALGLTIETPATTEPDVKGKRHATLTMSWKHPQTGEVVEIKKPEDFRNPPFTLKSVDDLPIHASQKAQAVFDRLYTESLPTWGAEDAARKDQEAAQSAQTTAQAAPAPKPSLLNRIFGFLRKK